MSEITSVTTSCPPLVQRVLDVRRQTERICEPLAIEDYGLQSMPDCSPVKWHLAHVSWFFETFVLTPHLPNYQPYHPDFRYLFNSYYNAVGPRWPRPQRALLSRPTVAEVYDYRAYVDRALVRLFDDAESGAPPEVANILELGLQHEQQHQELILTDLKHAFAANPLDPVYQERQQRVGRSAQAGWRSFAEGLVQIGHEV